MIEIDEKTYCARHPKVETNLRCASCDTFICPKCLVTTPVGMKCRDCSAQKGNTLFTLSPLNMACAIGAGLLLGAVAGWCVEFSIGFFMIFLAFAYGGFAGEMIMRAAGRKRGVRMEIIAGVAMVVGAIGGRLFVTALFLASSGHPGSLLEPIRDLVIPSPIPLITIIVIIASAISRIRYI